MPKRVPQPHYRQAASCAMTADPDTDRVARAERGPRAGAAQRQHRAGAAGRAAGVVAAALALMTIGRAQAQPYILGLLALLAMVGLFNLFAFAAGIIRFADRGGRRSRHGPHRRSRV